MPRGRFERRDLFIRHAGGADDMHRPRLRRDGREFQGGRRGGEIDDSLRRGDRLQRIVGHRHPQRRAAHRFAHVPTDPVMAGAFHGTDELQPIAVCDLFDQHSPHAS